MFARVVAILQRKLGRDAATIAPHMTKEEALELARRTAEAEGWPFSPVYSVVYQAGWFGKPGHWFLTPETLFVGQWLRITIDDRARTVVHKSYFCGPR